jgi:DNA polymerase elongation subunit (family B)
MFRNCYYDGRTNSIHLWEQINNQRLYTKIPWVPYIFEESEKGDIKTIDGKIVEKVKFSTGGEYREYTKDNHNCYENKVLPVVQFLAERYYSIDDEELEVPKLKIYSLDIEVNKEEGGFPSAEDAEDPISLINIKEFNGPSISWGIGKYTGNYNLQYKYFDDEKKLLKNFLNYMMSNAPDVLTGWNISSDTKMNKYGGFDLLYIINRCKYLFGEDTNEYKKLSPIRQVMVRENTDGTHVIDIAGVSILDYLPIFKWYTTKNLPDNKLETVCQEELGVGKLEIPYNSFQEFYKKDYNLYVDYNATDTQRIEDLEAKLGYISLVQQLSLLCKMPMRYYSAATHAGEGLLLTYYRRNNLCAPKLVGGTQEWFPAAFVKEPKKGLHSWVSDLDIASSYPTAMVTLNMSIETYYGRILTIDKVKRMNLNHHTDYDEEKIVKYSEQKSFEDPFYFKTNTGIKLIKDKKLSLFNKAIQKGMISISPCGTCFLTKPEGVIAHVERTMFLKRKEVKRKMFMLEKENEKKNDENIKNKIKQLFAFQWAIKIIINGIFGIQGVPYSRYFNVDVAEAITSCGKLNVLKGQEFANELLNNPNDYLKDIINEIKGKS